MKAVSPGDERLVDRTGTERLATTDPITRTIYLTSTLTPPRLDRVVLHEVTHALTVSHRLIPALRASVSWVDVEEWSAQLLENHAIEAIDAARKLLGRPLCVWGTCI